LQKKNIAVKEAVLEKLTVEYPRLAAMLEGLKAELCLPAVPYSLCLNLRQTVVVVFPPNIYVSVSFAARQTEDGGADTVASDVTDEEPEEQQHCCLSDDQQPAEETEVCKLTYTCQ
jgi:hypothetical protein